MRHFSVARLFKSMTMACIALTSAPLMAVDFDQSQYDVYIGDRNGDGRDDILLVAKDSIIPIHGEVLVPLAVQLSENYAIESGPGFYYDPVTLSDAEIDLSGFALATNTVIYDYNNDGQLDLVIGQQGTSLGNIALLGGVDSSEDPILVANVDEYDVLSTPPNPGSIGIAENHVNAGILKTSDELAPIAGEFRVNESGAATYSIPIYAPPGSAGVTPQITLNYSSQSGNSLLGLGWSLGGLSSISRCRQTMATDGHAAPITWSNEDRYCLDGQRLILETGSTYGAVGASYKTEIDNFSTVTSVGGTLGHPEYFIMKSKDGSTSEFGRSISSSFNNTRGETLNWAISKFSDSVGNKIDFSYTTTPNSQRASRIDYGSETTNHSSLVFQYESRPYDKLTSYTAGFRTETVNRLKSIVVSANSTVLRHYQLTYDHINTDFSRIVKVEECSDSSMSNCRGATNFDWQYPATGFNLTSERLYDLESTGFVDFKPLDINGDGNLDLAYIRSSGGGSNHYFAYAVSDGNTLDMFPNEEPYVEDVGRHTVKLEVIDYNADGRSDVLVYNELDSRWTLFLSEFENGTWTLNKKSSITLPFNEEETSFGDINSDGLVDAFYYESDTLHVHKLEKSGASISSNQYYHFAQNPESFPISVSGLPSYFDIAGHCDELKYRTSGTFIDLKSGAVGDYNGDGRIDLVFSARRSFNISSDYQSPVDRITDPHTQPVKASDFFLGFINASVNSTTVSSVLPSGAAGCPDRGFSLTNYIAYTFPQDGESPIPLGRLADQHVFDDTDDEANVLSVDINADGNSDIAILGRTNTDSYRWTVKISDGIGYFPQTTLLTGTDDSIDKGAQFSDINNDGYLDFVFHDSDSSRLRVKYWLPASEEFEATARNIPRYLTDLTDHEYIYSPSTTETYQNSISTASNHFLASDDSDDSYFFLNIDGEGGQDLIHLDTSERTLRIYKNRQTGPVNHAIAKVTNGLGAETNLHYESSYVSDHYMGLNIGETSSTELQQVCIPVEEPGSYVSNCFNRAKTTLDPGQFYAAINDPFSGLTNRQTAATDMAPVTENPSSGYVVSYVSSSSPIPSNLNAMSTVSYFYGESKLQAAGRGVLGYKRLSTLDHQTGIETTTTYRQDYPYIGIPIKTETTYNGNLINQSFNEWNTKVFDRLDGVRYQPFTDKSEEINYKITSSFSGGFNVGLSQVSKVVTDNTYDDYGNLTYVKVTTTGDGNTYSVTTNNDYGSSVESKQWGRLRSTTVEHHRSGNTDSNISRTSEFDYYGFGCSGSSAMRGLLCNEKVFVGSPYELTTTYEYDTFGNQIKSTSSAVGENTRISSSSYSSDGRYMDRSINHYGQVVQDVVSWDAYGNPNEVKDLLGNSTQNKYSQMGESYLEYSDVGAYTVNYRRSPENCPSGSVYRQESIAPDNAQSYECIDKLGRTLRKATKLLNGNWSYVNSEYDTLGRMTRQSEPYIPGNTVHWTTYYYDMLGNVTRMDQPNYAGNSRNSYTNYDGLTKTEVNVLGQNKTETKNPLGELVLIKDNLNTSVSYTYNDIGELRFTKTSSGNLTNTVEMRFDSYGHKTQMIDPDKGTWNYTYNAFNEITRQVNGNGDIRTLEYDSLGRQIRRVEPDGTSQWVYNNTNTGDSRGQMDYEVLFDGSGNIPYQMDYTYDSFGRVSEMTTNIDGEEFTERTTYDVYGRTFQSVDAATVQNAMQYQYKNGHMHKVVNAADTSEVYYQANHMDARGNVTQYVQGAVTTTRAYDSATGFLTTVGSTVAGTFGTQDLSYSWDALSNLASRTEKSGAKNLTENFSYDGINRLRTSQIVGRSIQNYQYDAFGNTTFKTDVGDYKYGGACVGSAGPHAVCEITNGTTTETFDYDNNGNMLTHRVNGAVDRQFVYSSFDKPTRITKDDHTTEFEYGADRSRYKRVDTSNGEATTTLYIGSVEVLDKPDGSREIRRYINGTVLVTQDYNRDSNGNYQFARAVTRNILTDHLGSTDVITDANGQIVQEQSFDAWGARRATTDGVRLDDISLVSLADVNNEFTTKGFTGHEAVDQVGVIHMNGRIYDARLGRFLQADPNIDGTDTTQGFNRYSYVKNNPLNATDPTGFFLDKVFGHLNKALGDFAPYFSIALLAIPGVGAWAASSWLNAAAIGFVSGGISTGSLQGAISGAISGAAFSQIGSYLGDNFSGGFAADLSATGFGLKVAGHALTGGVMSVLQGGKFGHGFASAGVTAGFVNINNSKFWGGAGFSPSRVLAAAVIGGTTSKLTGGKFGNGALTGAFSQALNNESQEIKKENNLQGASDSFKKAYSELSADYPELTKGLTIIPVEGIEKAEACIVEHCIKIPNSDFVNPEIKWTDHYEIIAHESLHRWMIQEYSYAGVVVMDIHTLQPGRYTFLPLRGLAHQYVIDKAADFKHWVVTRRVLDKPTYSGEEFARYYNENR